MFSSVSPQLRSNNRFILELIPRLDFNKVEYVVKHLHVDLRKDHEVMQTATKYFDKALKSANSALRADRAFVLSALLCSPSPLTTLECASAKLQRDKTLHLEAVLAWKKLLGSLEKLPNFDILMRDGSAQFEEQDIPLMVAAGINPDYLKREFAKDHRLFPSHGDFFEEDGMEAYGEIYNSHVAILRDARRLFKYEERTPSRSRSPRH